MTTRLLSPWGARQSVAGEPESLGSTSMTPTLDWGSTEVQELTALVVAVVAVHGARAALVEAHALIAARVRPVYALEELQTASRTLRTGRGSCSQRFAVLEAVARNLGVRTRVRGLLVDGRFWYPRFGRARWLVPSAVVLAWPEFRVDGVWLSAGELFDAADACGTPFANSGSETLFDAVARTRVAWGEASEQESHPGTCDLSAVVVRELGRFESRDVMFDRVGQTLCWGARRFGDPVLGRWAAGAVSAARR